MRRSLLVFALGIVGSVPSGAANNPFVGTWKLDPARSSYPSSTFTYTKLDNGSYHFTVSDGPSFDIGFEGKEYTVGGGNTISQTMDGDNAWNSVWKHNGVISSKDRGEISPDNKTLTITQNRVRPDGSIGTSVSVLTRVSGTTGPNGSWKLIKQTTESYTLIVTSPSEGVVHWEIPEYKEILEGKCDGSDFPDMGPLVSPGSTEAITMISPTKIAYTDKADGKPIKMGTRTISSNGKMLTDESWTPGKESEKSTDVYVKQ